MQKVSLVGHSSVREDLIRRLQEMGLMQVINLGSTIDSNDLEDVGPLSGACPQEVENDFNQVVYIIRYLNQFAPERKGLIEGFMGLKTEIGPDAFDNIVRNFDIKALHEICRQDDARLSSINNQRARITSEIRLLEPWEGVEVSLNALTGMKRTNVIAASCPTRAMAEFSGSIENHLLHYEVVKELPSDTFMLLYYIGTDPEIPEIMRRFGINRINLPESEKTPKEFLDGLRSDLESLDALEKEISQRGQGLAGENRLNLHVLYDYLGNLRETGLIQADFLSTEKTFMVSGWVKAKDIEAFKAGIRDLDKSIHVTVEDPGPDDRVPVFLENKPWIAPFEIVTNIYGFPSYGEIDPTPLLAPFFLIFFGMALGDAAYGLILVALSLYFMKQYRLERGGRKFFTLIIYGGVSTVIIGALMGSWFGNLFELLPPWLSFLNNFRNAIFMIDPMQDPLTMLIISLALGIIQIWFGIAIKMYANLKAGAVADALGDQVPWLVLIPAIILFAVGDSLQLGQVSAVIPYIVLIAALGVVVGTSRGQRNILLKPFTGLYGLYGGVGYLSDTLSYARLLALGLASGVIANVINQIAMLVKGIPVLAYIIVPVILIGGHIFNLLINVLGSFIHSGRLQFVEFFTKFFEGGGRRFTPFSKENKYVEVR